MLYTHTQKAEEQWSQELREQDGAGTGGSGRVLGKGSAPTGAWALGQAALGAVTALSLPEFKKGLDSALRHLPLVSSQELDLVGPLHLRMLCGSVALRGQAQELFALTRIRFIIKVKVAAKRLTACFLEASWLLSHINTQDTR